MQPSICVIGGGLAGLTTCLNLKERLPKATIVVLEKTHPQANTQIAGMRFRLKKSGSLADGHDEYAADITRLLASQNNEMVTPQMIEFGQLAASEVLTWEQRLKAEDSAFSHQESSWFGPQWGKTNASGIGGRGLSILNFLRDQAQAEGIQFITGEAQELLRDGTDITGVVINNKQGNFLLEAQEVVVANANAGGALYESTNKVISRSGSELLFNAGFALEGATHNMWHPFGHCSDAGTTRSGCYETDNLAGAQVWLADGTFDAETTDLLAQHRAHYHFKDICQRFIEHGSISRLVMPDGEIITARVSLHYSHLGAVTVDGSRVKGGENMYVVGDAGGFLYWSNHQPRLPGFALTHCLVSARVCADRIYEKWISDTTLKNRELRVNRLDSLSASPENFNGRLRKVNTDSTLQLEFQVGESGQVLANWQKTLEDEVGETTLLPLAQGLVRAWEAKLRGEKEPIFTEQQIESHHEGQQEMTPLRRRL